MPAPNRYSVCRVRRVQQRTRTNQKAVNRARRLIKKLESELIQAKIQLAKATERYKAAKADLDHLGIETRTNGFRVDENGYVIPKKPVLVE